MVHRHITCLLYFPAASIRGRKRIKPVDKKDSILAGRGGKGKLPFFSSRVGDKPWTKTDVPTLTAVGLCSEPRMNPDADDIYFRSVFNYASVFQVISFRCLPKSCVHFSPMRATSPCPLHPLWFDMQRGLHIPNLLIKDFLHAPITSFLLGSNILLYTGVFRGSK